LILEFATRYLSFLKGIPFLPHLLDTFVKIETFITQRKVLDYIDEVRQAVKTWSDTGESRHRFGGLEFRVFRREIGHIHSNGLLDIYFPMARRNELVAANIVEKHHVFPASGWISFYIRKPEDVATAIALLKESYQRHVTNGPYGPSDPNEE